MLRLAHPALLDIFRDRTAGQLLKGRFQLGRAHAGDPGEPVQWNLKRIMVIQICDDIFKLCRILCGQLFFFSVGELLLFFDHKRNRFRNFCLIVETGGDPAAPVIFHFIE